MPITLEPIYRRNFITGSLILGGSAWIKSYALAKPVNLDTNRVALLADTHISDDPKRSYPGTKWPGSPIKEEEHEWVNMADSLSQSAREVIVLNPRPANLIINGDCALSRGTEAEYKEFLRLIEPIRQAGITVHITIGNHDTREKLWKLLPFLKKEQMGIHADVIKLPNANIFLLDSGKKGILGEAQLDWLAQQLDKHNDRPALVFAHFNPLPNRGVRPIRGMRDGEALLKVLARRKHAKAYIHGHTHEWQKSIYEEHLHIIGQPAVSYYFGKGHAHGWIDMKLNETSADLKLRCIDPNHPQDSDRLRIDLKG
jgi:3',5'-cyclic AMP phosphodiesterase CpdA